MNIVFRLIPIFFICYTQVWAAEVSSTWYSKSSDHKVVVNVDLFLSSTCPYCQKANVFFSGVEVKSPDLHIQRYFIDEDKNALIRFNQLLNEQHMDDFAVPSIFFCNSRWVGFVSAATTGKDLLHAIYYCKEQIEKEGMLTEATVNTLRHWANANRFSTGVVENPSRLNYTSSVALMDSFSPCSLFVFAGFLAFLFIEKQKKKRLIAGFLYGLSVVLVHYFQQVHTGVFFQLLPWLRVPAALLGLMTFYFVRQRYKKQSADILYFSLAFLLGLITMIYQQTCVMNWSSIFQQWLNNQQISNWQSSLYQLLYQGIYLLPLISILIIYLILPQIKRFVAFRAKIVNIGLLFLTAIALCLIVYPFVLSYRITSLLILILLVVCGYLISF